VKFILEEKSEDSPTSLLHAKLVRAATDSSLGSWQLGKLLPTLHGQQLENSPAMPGQNTLSDKISTS